MCKFMLHMSFENLFYVPHINFIIVLKYIWWYSDQKCDFDQLSYIKKIYTSKRILHATIACIASPELNINNG